MTGLSLQLRCSGAQGFRLEVDCALPARGVTAVHGASGSGKTTLLDCIAGLRGDDVEGTISLDGEQWLGQGRSLPTWQRAVGYVFNDARLFPHLSVEGNLRYALARRRNRQGPRYEQVVDWLELDALLARDPASLSAGQQQRVAIGRALLSAPRVLLLDEPLSNLDPAASLQCLHCLQRMSGELAIPVLYVSHDIEEVSQLADHLLLLEAGRIVAQGSLLELCARLDNRLSQEEQAAAILHATVRGHDTEFGLTSLDLEGEELWVSRLPQAPGTTRRVRVPARDVSLCRERPGDSSILNILPVTIREMADSGGTRVMLRLKLGSQFLLARITRRSASTLGLAVGDRVFAQIKSAALLMDGGGEA